MARFTKIKLSRKFPNLQYQNRDTPGQNLTRDQGWQTVLLSNHNICFGREIRKLFFCYAILTKVWSCSRYANCYLYIYGLCCEKISRVNNNDRSILMICRHKRLKAASLFSVNTLYWQLSLIMNICTCKC